MEVNKSIDEDLEKIVKTCLEEGSFDNMFLGLSGYDYYNPNVDTPTNWELMIYRVYELYKQTQDPRIPEMCVKSIYNLLEKNAYSIWCVSQSLYFFICEEQRKTNAPFKIIDNKILEKWKQTLISNKKALCISTYNTYELWLSIKSILKVLKEKCNIEILTQKELNYLEDPEYVVDILELSKKTNMVLDSNIDLVNTPKIYIKTRIDKLPDELIYIYETGIAIKFNLSYQICNSTIYHFAPEKYNMIKLVLNHMKSIPSDAESSVIFDNTVKFIDKDVLNVIKNILIKMSNDTSEDILWIIADNYILQKKYDELAKYSDVLLKLKITKISTMARIAEILENNSKREQAINLYKKLIALGEKRAYLKLINLYSCLNQKELAKEFYNVAKNLNSDEIKNELHTLGKTWLLEDTTDCTDND